MDRHGVLTDATAIAFRMLFALAFLTLTGLALAGAVHLDGIWRDQLGPNIARIVSPNFYRELDHSVDQVLTTRRLWWLSIGLLLTLWQVSSGVRALMTALDSIYEVKDRRPFRVRMGLSVGLAALIIVALFLIAAALLPRPRLKMMRLAHCSSKPGYCAPTRSYVARAARRMRFD